MGNQAEARFQKYYFSRPSFVDGTTEFHALIRRQIPAGSKVLEIGSGPRNATSEFLASSYGLSGVDVSQEISTNTALSEALVYDGRILPFESGVFDACVSNYVIEHIQDPTTHFSEVARVLKPNGVYAFRTPNLFHYVSLISRLLPNRFHGVANTVRGVGDDAHEPYPTFYRANTLGSIKRLASKAGLQPIQMEMVEKEPSYGRSHSLLFYPMLAYERLVNCSDLFSLMRVNIFAVFKKSA